MQWYLREANSYTYIVAIFFLLLMSSISAFTLYFSIHGYMQYDEFRQHAKILPGTVIKKQGFNANLFDKSFYLVSINHNTDNQRIVEAACDLYVKSGTEVNVLELNDEYILEETFDLYFIFLIIGIVMFVGIVAVIIMVFYFKLAYIYWDIHASIVIYFKNKHKH
ncbi:MAG: hypothetical protein OEZ01_15465 [Candidatus Heimdallarchaeota archaeon]|nr:hypothetical protein [Candidatus Heimdallarchaeota archaeon]